MGASIPSPPNVLSPEHVVDPWPGLAVLREHYPVHYDADNQFWMLSRYSDIRPISRGSGPGPAFQELLGQYLGNAVSFPSLDGAEHRHRRRLLAPFFARSGVESFQYRIERQARGLLEPIVERERAAVAAGLRTRGEMDFIEEFTSRFPLHVMIDMLDLPEVDYSRMHAWFRAWTGAEGNVSRNPELFERALWAREDFGEFVLPIIAERRSSNADDLISKMCTAELDGMSLPDEEVRSIAAGMILGGGETTDHQLGWLMHELAGHPKQQQALAEDRALMDKALAESMRHSSIVQYIGRTPSEDLEIHGTTIPAGSSVALLIASANHDPDRWQNPDEFDMFRADHDASKAFVGSAEHLGFGAGPHFCIGSHLSKMEMEVAMNLVLDNIGDIRLADGFEAQPEPDAPFIRALPSLKITFELQ
jgi:pulcherriminic acid synthase